MPDSKWPTCAQRSCATVRCVRRAVRDLDRTARCIHRRSRYESRKYVYLHQSDRQAGIGERTRTHTYTHVRARTHTHRFHKRVRSSGRQARHVDHERNFRHLFEVRVLHPHVVVAEGVTVVPPQRYHSCAGEHRRLQRIQDAPDVGISER